MNNASTQTLIAAAAAAAAQAGDPVYVDDVFSTFLYDGNSATNTITNGIDLAGEGGLVWIKKRDGVGEPSIFDTVRGGSQWLRTSGNDSQLDLGSSDGVTTFNSDGFVVKGNNVFNGSGEFVSWTFRKAPGFCDVISYTGNGVAGRQISHALGSTPGMVIVKRTNGADNWTVQHRSLGGTKSLYLNLTDGQDTSSTEWNNTAATSTVFTVGTSGKTNANGDTYVAYIFAHDDAQFGTDEDESIIKCGSYTGNGNTEGPTIDLGFEPQFVLLRCATRSGNNGGGWYLFNHMQGIFSGSNDPTVQAQESNAESTNSNADIALTPTGFQATGSGVHSNASGGTYIYMAIRRPHKPPEAGTDVFSVDRRGSSSGGDGLAPTYRSNFPVDWYIQKAKTSNTDNPEAAFRLLGPVSLDFSSNDQASVASEKTFDYNNGVEDDTGSSSSPMAWMFKRAPGFCDVLTYVGNGSNRQISHNLTVIPELMICKRRSGAENWHLYHSSQGPTKYARPDLSNSFATLSSIWNDTAPTEDVFSVGTDHGVNRNTDTYIAILFATLEGISKVGSYTGTGSDQDIDCGFTGGARFVLVKRVAGGGSWAFWDTLRGINSGNEPYLRLDVNSAEVSRNYIDPLNAGFTIKSGNALVNSSGDEYVFLAIA